MYLAFGEITYQPHVETWFTKILKESLDEIATTSEYFEKMLDKFNDTEGDLIQFRQHEMNKEYEIFHACEEWLYEIQQYLDTTILSS
jgi:hypothetical protein